MRYGWLMLMSAGLWSLPALGLAQTAIQVPIDKGRFVWDAPADPPPAGAGPTRWMLVNCSGSDVRVDVPGTSLPINQVVTAPGTYHCTLRAANNFGESAALSFPQFDAGYLPGAPVNLRIEVQ